MLNKLRLVLIVSSLAVALIALGLWDSGPASIETTATASASDNLSFYASNAHIRQFQADGKLKYDLVAPQFEHFKESDTGYVTTPELKLYQGATTPWNITSLRAEISPGGDEVELIEQVRLAKIDSKQRATILTTERLTVFPDKEFAQTQQAVRIEAAQGVTTAVGMKAYLNEGRMLLLSNVRGQHEVR